MKVMIAIWLCGAGLCWGEGTNKLVLPAQVTLPWDPEKIVQTGKLAISNPTTQTIGIIGQATSCGCSSLTLTQTTLLPNTVAWATFTLTTNQSSLLFVDSLHNLYQVQIQTTNRLQP